jgi:hypothetical protein
MGGHGPPARPRMRPSMPTSIAQLPILELPEPSPHSSSLLDTQLRGRAEPAEAEEEEEFVGGTCVGTACRPPPVLPRSRLSPLPPPGPVRRWR